MKTIYGYYKIDENGTIYSKRGKLKIRIDNNYPRVNINQKWVSYARIVATYLVPNPNNYDHIIYLDGDVMNCQINNLKWVSENKYNMYVYKKQMKKRSLEKEEAIKKCECEIVKEYYKTNNIEVINKHFINISKKITINYWNEVMGCVYLKLIESLSRFAILYSIDKYIMSRLKFHKLDIKL